MVKTIKGFFILGVTLYEDEGELSIATHTDVQTIPKEMALMGVWKELKIMKDSYFSQEEIK